ncbi:amidohydrolase family protein [Thermopolyspora sp. NPDC052614]|uniref:amidohydrolase family protein n=1 Tax=Thermopolyspora sp. NPDC052614 TaxID=3155682 RepID=UPI00344923DC
MTDKFALVNVRVFDGWRLTDPTLVVVENGLIGQDPAGAERVDVHGAVLLPGLIDAHVHVDDAESLHALARHGVTTGLDMAVWPRETPAALRALTGTADLRSAGLPAIGPGGNHARMLGLPPEAIVTEPDRADQWVADRVAEGSDYIKIVLEAPGEGGPEADVARAVVEAAHARNRQVVAHATSAGAYAMALDAGADHITHCPIGAPADPADVTRMLDQGRTATPTLVMMREIAGFTGRPDGFAGSMATVTRLHAACVPILAGTDAHVQPGLPFQVRHGLSLHEELRLLVEAGLSPAEALRSATVLPAHHFALHDRGVIAPGKRADLVLLDGDPLADIGATAAVLRVWCAGIEHETAPTATSDLA